MSRSANTTAVLYLFLWGASFPVGKHALSEVNALTLVMWRFSIASVCLYLYTKYKHMPIPTLTPKQWAWAIGVSIIGVGGLNLGLFTGLEQTNANNGALIMALSPLVTSLIGSIAQRQFPTKGALFSLVVCLSGVLLVLTDGAFAKLLGFEFNHGDQMIFYAVLESLYLSDSRYQSLDANDSLYLGRYAVRSWGDIAHGVI